MTVRELLDRTTSAELTEWMGLWTLRNQEQKEAQSSAGPPVVDPTAVVTPRTVILGFFLPVLRRGGPFVR